jgi:hypothetical protein
VLAYLYGKPVERQEITGNQGGPLQIVIREVLTTHAND